MKKKMIVRWQGGVWHENKRNRGRNGTSAHMRSGARKTKEEVIKEVEYFVKSDADMIEWRLDAFEHYTDYNEVREILQQIAPLLKKKLFLYTFRTAKQGGVVSVDRETLNDLHDLAAESECVDLIDLEFLRRNMRQSGSGKFKKGEESCGITS